MSQEDRIPEAAIKRLPIYLRVLRELAEEKVEIVSSADLSARTGFSSEQIRKDLAYFGAFGTRGVGYRTDTLSERLKKILGLETGVRVAVVGAGNLGTTLARYNLRRYPELEIVAVFDNDWDKIGKKIEELEILPMEDLPQVVNERNITMGLIAVPPTAAEEVAEQLVEAGIAAILNFSPAKLDINSDVHVHNIDLSIELQSLAYYATRKAREKSTGGETESHA
jgi:redox-sensing transcriptional repressor